VSSCFTSSSTNTLHRSAQLQVSQQVAHCFVIGWRVKDFVSPPHPLTARNSRVQCTGDRQNKPYPSLFFLIPSEGGQNTQKTAIDSLIYTNGVVYTMRERYFVIWDCKCETRNMNNNYGYSFPTKDKLRYFCRNCGSFKRMDSGTIKVKLITQSIKRATVVMLDE
jgi:hypothetical protein